MTDQNIELLARQWRMDQARLRKDGDVGCHDWDVVTGATSYKTTTFSPNRSNTVVRENKRRRKSIVRQSAVNRTVR